MIERILTHQDVSRTFSNGAVTEDLKYYLPKPRLGDTLTFFMDSHNSIHLDTNDPNVVILSNLGATQQFIFEGKSLGDSIVLKCVGDAWRIIPRFF